MIGVVVAAGTIVLAVYKAWLFSVAWAYAHADVITGFAPTLAQWYLISLFVAWMSARVKVGEETSYDVIDEAMKLAAGFIFHTVVAVLFCGVVGTFRWMGWL